MPLDAYGVLVGAAVDKRIEAGDRTPHFQIQLRASGTDYRIAVNVRSAQDPPDLLYLADEAFAHPVVASLVGLDDGFHGLPSSPGGAALDFIRGNLFDRTLLRPLPSNLPGPDNDLSDRLDHFVSRALADPQARVYAFGQRWGPESGLADKVFGFLPGNGIHDIHMNQGNGGQFAGDNGVWQDGALLIHFPAQSQWVGFFLAFQSQGWHTDDRTGHIIPVAGDAGDRRVRIIAALVNPVGPAPELETITLAEQHTGQHRPDRVVGGRSAEAPVRLAGAESGGRRRPPRGGAGAGLARQQGRPDHAAGRPGTEGGRRGLHRRRRPRGLDHRLLTRSKRSGSPWGAATEPQFPRFCPGPVLPTGRRSPSRLA